MMRLTSMLIIGLLLAGPGPAEGTRVAIFDYDDRVPFPDALGRHIEARLRAMIADIEIEHYSGRGSESESVGILSALERKGLDLLIVRTSDALIIAQHTVFETPVLYTNVNNPLILGFRTLGPPGGNISGASYYIPVEKRLSAFRAIQPFLRKPGFIFDRHNQSRKAEVPEAREACAGLGMIFDSEFIETKDQLRRAVKALIARGADAIVATSSGTVYEHIDSFVDLTDNAGIPVYSFYKTGVFQGAVAAMSSDFFQMADELLLPMAQRVLVDKVSPGDLPAAFLKKNRIFINKRRAARLKLKVPENILVDDAEVTVVSVQF
jgi:ABC-type uncharacterized transport system substrate-binding protein